MKANVIEISIFLLFNISLLFCQGSKDYMKTARELSIKGDSLKSINYPLSNKYFDDAMHNYAKAIEVNPHNYDAYYFAGKLAQHIEWIKNPNNPNPAPIYPFYLKLYQTVMMNPKVSISKEFSNREILYDLSNIYQKSDKEKAIFYLEEALKISIGKNNLVFSDKRIVYKISELYFDHAMELKMKGSFNRASHCFHLANQYYNKCSEYDYDLEWLKDISDNISECKLQIKICKFQDKNPRWKVFDSATPYGTGTLERKEFIVDNYLISYDSETLKRHKDIVDVWIKKTFLPEDVIPDYQTYESKTYFNFNIRTNKSLISKAFIYGKNGEIVDSSENLGKSWEDIIPDTFTEYLFKKIKKIFVKK